MRHFARTFLALSVAALLGSLAVAAWIVTSGPRSVAPLYPPQTPPAPTFTGPGRGEMVSMGCTDVSGDSVCLTWEVVYEDGSHWTRICASRKNPDDCREFLVSR